MRALEAEIQRQEAETGARPLELERFSIEAEEATEQ